MRSIELHSGVTWHVWVAKDSYGIMVLLFSCRGDDGVRRLEIGANPRLESERTLGAFDPESLRSKLALANALGAARRAPR